MAFTVFTKREREGLSRKDLALLHEHIVREIQTSAEIREIIIRRADPLVESYPRIRQLLRRKVGPLRKQLKQGAKAGVPRKRRRKR